MAKKMSKKSLAEAARRKVEKKVAMSKDGKKKGLFSNAAKGSY